MAANPRNMRVQVDRMALIQAIERKQNQCKKDYERVGEKLELALRDWQEKKVAELRDQAKKLESEAKKLEKVAVSTLKKAVESSSTGYAPYFHLSGKSYRLPEMREATKFEGFSNILRMLKMSKKDSVSLTESQFNAYMDGCPVPK